jgi:hypothetical protein
MLPRKGPIVGVASDTQIAGFKNCNDWQSFKARLVPGCDPHLWEQAASEYFYERLDTRYLNPIRILHAGRQFRGEGFAIMAIQCSLIEFLEATFQGKKYRYGRKKNRCRLIEFLETIFRKHRDVQSRDREIGEYEYHDSKELFVSFLRKRSPFSKYFITKQIATDFYVSIRCGLFHEAQTKNGWKIRADAPNGAPVDATNKIVYPDNFQCAIDELIEWYKRALPADNSLQAAFIRKFDSLCQ